jgi:hypothetical protein
LDLYFLLLPYTSATAASKQVIQSKIPLASRWAVGSPSGFQLLSQSIELSEGGSSPGVPIFGSLCRVSSAMSSATAAMVV